MTTPHQNGATHQSTKIEGHDPLANVTFAPSAVPGIEQSDWARITSPTRHPLPEVGHYASLSIADKVELENRAILTYLDQKSPEYQAELQRIASALPEMSPRCKLELVAPAYNEHESIHLTLKAVADAANSASTSLGKDEWGMTIIVNRPVTNDPVREVRDAQNLRETVQAIEAFKGANPEIRLNYFVIECPREKANVGLARALGHDLTALRSSRRAVDTREAPMYIQTIDADTTYLNPKFFDLIVGRLKADGYSKDFYRERDEFAPSVIKEYPLAHVIDFMWNDAFSKLAVHTDQAWTVGRCMTVSLLAHCSAGGVYPFRFQGGVDEDIRIGTTIRLMRGMGNTSGQAEIETPILESDATRALMGLTEILQATERGDLTPPAGKLTRDLHEAARLLKYYRDFHNLSISSTQQFRQPDTSWLESSTEFQRAIPVIAIEAIANSFRQLAIEGLLQQNLRAVSPTARQIYSRFSEGLVPFSTMSDQMREWSAAALEDPDHAEHNFVESAMLLAHKQATSVIVDILRARAIECYVEDSENLVFALDSDPQSEIPRPVRVTSAEGLRQALIRKLLD